MYAVFRVNDNRESTVLLIGLLATSLPAHGQVEPLRAEIDQVINGKKATVGVGIYAFGSRQALTIQDDQHLPMQSVYKFHVVLVVLS